MLFKGHGVFLREHVEKSSESTNEEHVHIFYLQVFRMNESEKREREKRRKGKKRERAEEGRKRKERKESLCDHHDKYDGFLIGSQVYGCRSDTFSKQSNKALAFRVTFRHIADEEESV